MEVLYHIRPYFGGISPYIGLTYGRYLQFIGSCCMAIDLWLGKISSMVDFPAMNDDTGGSFFSHGHGCTVDLRMKNADVP